MVNRRKKMRGYRGHIKKRYKGSYTLVLNKGKDPVTGKRKQEWVSVKGTRKEAEVKLAELLHQLDTGIFIKPGKMKVAEYLMQWLKDNCVPNLSPRTVEGYESIIRCHLIPALGNIILTQLKPAHLQRLYSEKLSAGFSNRTTRYIHSTLHRSLHIAVKLGLLIRNPAGAVDPPKAQQREMRTMSESDIHIFLEYARSTRYYILFYLVLFTGLRRSEVLALKWSKVDLILCQLYVTLGLHQLQDGSLEFRQPKTAKGRRLVSLPPSAVLLLKEHRLQQEIERKNVGLELSEDDLVFSQEDGKPLLPNSVSHAWSKIANRAGLKGIRLHDARHTHASIMLKQGVHPKVVQERLGHASIQITLDTYSHVTPGLQQAAANRFDEIVTNKNQDSMKNEVEEISG